MTKRTITKTLFATVLTVGIVFAAVMDPNTRMEKVRDLFTEFGADTFKVLNGQDIGGTGASDSNKSQQNNSRSNIASVIKADDGNSFVFCVSDGKWAVYPPEPMKIGADAMTATDANGRPFTMTMIKALRASTDGKVHHIRYDVTTPASNREKQPFGIAEVY